MQSRENENRLYHYTIRECLLGIVRAGVIRPSTGHVPRGVRPAVWFSYNPVWEQTANKALTGADGRLTFLDMQGTHEHSAGLARLQIDPAYAPHDWDAYKRLSGANLYWAKRLYDNAMLSGAKPRDWRCSFGPVPDSACIAIEYWDGKDWHAAACWDSWISVVSGKLVTCPTFARP